MMLANKSDLEELRVVPTCHGEERAVKHDLPFFEVSAKENINVAKAIDSMARRIVESKVLNEFIRHVNRNFEAKSNSFLFLIGFGNEFK